MYKLHIKMGVYAISKGVYSISNDDRHFLTISSMGSTWTNNRLMEIIEKIKNNPHLVSFRQHEYNEIFFADADVFVGDFNDFQDIDTHQKIKELFPEAFI